MLLVLFLGPPPGPRDPTLDLPLAGLLRASQINGKYSSLVPTWVLEAASCFKSCSREVCLFPGSLVIPMSVFFIINDSEENRLQAIMPLTTVMDFTSVTLCDSICMTDIALTT